MPVISSHFGVSHAADSAPAAHATSSTTAPWPSENSAPASRASRGLSRAL